MNKKRILLKLSGELLTDDNNKIDNQKILNLCQEINNTRIKENLEIAIVIGGGNFWRGRTNPNMDRCLADNIGMLATTMNALILKDAFNSLNIKAQVLNAIEMNKITEFYTKEKAINCLEDNQIVIFAGGTANPFFSTDTAAALRASEIDADILIKATNVDGLYTSDPKLDINAKLIKETTYQEVLEKNLKVMDLTSITLCKENNIPIAIFNGNIPNNISNVLTNNNLGTIIK